MQLAAELEALGAEIVDASRFLVRVEEELSHRIVGQREVVRRVFIALLVNGHILLEGVPGLAKTLIVSSFAEAMALKFQRIQFTPDMLPADLVGTLIYNPKDLTFFPRKGPLFTNIVLADEINRSPAKVQSALLEAMQEHQVTIGDESYQLPAPFLVLATQNPIEHEGTYLLPEAQMDRFMMKVEVDYPSYDEELEIMLRSATNAPRPSIQAVAQPEDIERARTLIDRIYVDPRVQRYIVDLVVATRSPAQYGMENLNGMIECGASPRASIYMLLAAKAHAFLQQRPYITPEDVKAVVYDVLRHRIRPGYEAEAENMRSTDIIRQILQHVQVP